MREEPGSGRVEGMHGALQSAGSMGAMGVEGHGAWLKELYGHGASSHGSMGAMRLEGHGVRGWGMRWDPLKSAERPGAMGP